MTWEDNNMACRVGITTDLEERKAYWQRQHPNLYGWRIEGTYYTKSQAQAAENQIAAQRGCVAHPGGAGLEYATWYVYSFQY